MTTIWVGCPAGRIRRLESLAVVLGMLVIGCGFDPAGRYTGDVDVDVTTSRQTTPTDDRGRSTAETTFASFADNGVAIIVARRDGRTLTVALGNWCTIEVLQDPDDSRRASIDPVRSAECNVDVANHQGPARFAGTVDFDEREIEIHLDGTIRAGPQTGVGAIWGSYDYNLRGQKD